MFWQHFSDGGEDLEEKNLRLDKYLADMKVGTRSEVRIYIRKCRVAVNGETVRDIGYKVSPADRVTFDGGEIGYTEKEYIMLNKPAGVLTATKDKKTPTVLSLLSGTNRRDLFPVGRLDKDTEGLLLLTNDGQLAHNLLSPKKHVDKVYYAKVSGRVEEEHVARFAAGLSVDEDFTALPAKLEILGTGEVSEVRLTIQEGKFHQVKRMFAAVGMEVLYLKRLAMGSLWLDGTLREGEYRALSTEELSGLMCLCGGRQDGMCGAGNAATLECAAWENTVGASAATGKGTIGDGTAAAGGTQDAATAEHTAGDHTAAASSARARAADEIPCLLTAMMDGVKGVLFDLDGTLVDSMWMWEQIDIEYLGRFGISLPAGLQGQIEGMSFSETAQYFKGRFPQITESIEEMKVTWNRMAWEKYAREVFLKPGVLGFLKYLKSRGIRTGIATSNSAELVHTVLSALSAEEYFDEVHTACEVGAGKPAPDIYLYVAKTLGVAPESCLVFEDICKGIEAGKAAGMRVCAVQDVYSKEAEEKKRAMADYFIQDYTELGFAKESGE